MLNFRLVIAGLAITLMSAYVVAYMDTEAEATCYSVTIGSPEDGTIFYEGAEIDVSASFSLPGDELDSVAMTAELQCTLSSRVESTSTAQVTLMEGMFTRVLIGPDDEDSDVGQGFCVVASAGGYTDRVGVTFIPEMGMCCP